jgi:cyclophilin family peptidyl-prolyl cis-trans isomerase
MSKFFIKILLFLFILTNQSMSEENLMILKLKDGDVKIELFPDVAPNHVKRIKELADSGRYDNVVFHRVIDGFMAQTGDVQFGNSESGNFDYKKSWYGRI